MRCAFVILALPVAGCGGMRDVPSLAARPVEATEIRGLAAATGTSLARRPADPALVREIAALLATVREGEDGFARAENASASLVARGRSSLPGSEAWLAAQAALSSIEAARQNSAEGLAAIDQLLVAQTAAGGAGLAEIQAAKLEAERIVQRQSERLNQIGR